MSGIRMPETGQAAPAIRAVTASGEPFDLADHRGSWVVVYFYPRANSPG